MNSTLQKCLAAGMGGQWAGLSAGLVHAVALGSVGLYAESGVAVIVASALRYLALGALAGLAAGLLLQPVAGLARRRGPVPAAAIVGALYPVTWGAFFLKQAREDGIPFAIAGFGMLVIALAVLTVGRRMVLPAPRPAVVLVGPVAAVLALAIPAGQAKVGSFDAWSAIDHVRPEAMAVFAPGGWNVLLITYDTLRADHLGSYGYERARTPDLDSLAAAGVQFENAIVQRPKTSPNVASFLSGTYPAWHGIHTPMRRLPDRVQTLAEMLSDAGWTTGAVITNGNLYPEFAFDQGYGEYHYGHGGAGEGADLALDWLERHGEGPAPWHLWVHMTDPHWPYSPPREWEDAFVTPDLAGPARQIALYDGEIAYASQQTGRILSWLSGHPAIRDRTLVVMTADHGESLGEHDYSFEHGMHPYEPSARIPLVLSMPGRIPAGESRDAVVASVDLVPTILDAVDVDAPDVVQGHSILPLVTGLATIGPRGFVYLEAGYGEHIGPGRTRAVRTRTTKYVSRVKDWAIRPGVTSLVWTFDAAIEGGLAPDEYYDLTIDPDEVNPIGGTHPERRAEVAAFHGWLTRQIQDASSDGTIELDAETEASLRSLGYIE